MFWLYGRSMETRSPDRGEVRAAGDHRGKANRRALNAGSRLRETTEIFHTTYRVAPANLAPGTYRNITGNEATALGQLTASKLADRLLVYASYPITPASEILHQLSGWKELRAQTFQAEDEIAAIGAALRRQLRRRDGPHRGPRGPGWP